MLPLQAVQPHALPGTPGLSLRSLCKSQVVERMGTPGACHLPTRVESLQPILADRLQHQQARLPLLFRLAQQALVNERRHPIQEVFWDLIKSRIQTFHCPQCAAASEDGEPPEESLFLSIEQFITPCKRVAECLLPGRGISPPARQDLQAMREARQQRLWGKQFDARRCQFDEQR